MECMCWLPDLKHTTMDTHLENVSLNSGQKSKEHVSERRRRRRTNELLSWLFPVTDNDWYVSAIIFERTHDHFTSHWTLFLLRSFNWIELWELLHVALFDQFNFQIESLTFSLLLKCHFHLNGCKLTSNMSHWSAHLHWSRTTQFLCELWFTWIYYLRRIIFLRKVLMGHSQFTTTARDTKKVSNTAGERS